MSNGKKEYNEDFTVLESKLDQVDQYCYLGIRISETGNFKMAEKAMADKTTKALFKT